MKTKLNTRDIIPFMQGYLKTKSIAERYRLEFEGIYTCFKYSNDIVVKIQLVGALKNKFKDDFDFFVSIWDAFDNVEIKDVRGMYSTGNVTIELSNANQYWGWRSAMHYKWYTVSGELK